MGSYVSGTEIKSGGECSSWKDIYIRVLAHHGLSLPAKELSPHPGVLQIIKRLEP